MIRKRNLQLFFRYLIIIVIALGALIPFFWMVLLTFKEPTQIFARPLRWWVDSFDLSNYTKFFTQYNGWRYTWNTVRLCAINVLGAVLSNAIVAYAVAFMRFKYKKIIILLLLGTMMMPGTVTFFPQFIVFVKIGWYGTLMPLWVPAFLGNAYYIFLLRQYYLTIPQPILDAARVAGASHFRILWQIVVPLAKPVFIMIVLNTFISVWSDLFGPLIYILNEDDKTLPVLLSYMQSSYGNFNTMPSIMAGSILSAIPTLLVYFLGQRAMIKAYVFKSGDK